VNKNTYHTNAGKSMTHIINGMAGNIESHSEFSSGQSLTNITAVLNTKEYGFSKMTVVNSTALKWEYIRGNDGSVGDSLWLLKPASEHKSHRKKPSPNHGEKSHPVV
jgi:acid phosphatase